MKVICENCGKEFDKKPSHVKLANEKGHKHYCSRTCQYEGLNKKVECTCGFCGEIIYKSQSEIDKSKSGLVFCDKSCACSYNNKILRAGKKNPNWKDGIGSYFKNAMNHYKTVVKDLLNCFKI